jgi:UDP-N-acetylglucosamine acyltransferase
MNSLLFADLPPFVMCQGQPALARSMNFEGMRRRGFNAEQIQTAKNIYKLLYRDGLTLLQSMQAIEQLAKDHPDSKEVISLVSGFLSSVSSQRGIVR